MGFWKQLWGAHGTSPGSGRRRGLSTQLMCSSESILSFPHQRSVHSFLLKMEILRDETSWAELNRLQLISSEKQEKAGPGRKRAGQGGRSSPPGGGLAKTHSPDGTPAWGSTPTVLCSAAAEPPPCLECPPRVCTRCDPTTGILSLLVRPEFGLIFAQIRV